MITAVLCLQSRRLDTEEVAACNAEWWNWCKVRLWAL